MQSRSVTKNMLKTAAEVAVPYFRRLFTTQFISLTGTEHTPHRLLRVVV